MRSLPPLRTRLDSPSLAFLPAIVLAAGLLNSPAGGTLITTGFSGAIQTAPAGNSLGLTTVDPVLGSATYDDALISPTGFSALSVDDDPAFDLALSIGGFLFEAVDDVDFGFGFPVLEFLDGVLSGLDFIAASPTDPGVGLSAFENTFSVTGTDFDSVDGILDFSVQTGVVGNQFATDVPEPLAMIVLGFGLALLAGLRRRDRSA